ncbi:hypothetical protein PROFUN_07390 [Planoprotostelium fungivorum]|uniref:DSL domain-containing protein n=1 Tax=Planoprotostelium fungivorum TaxID=1890364 RepID=A0A2P6MTI4_9EUKA|nr:hypothetical protein PROFUN_07390 [Planoprotostelium fungivorum]
MNKLILIGLTCICLAATEGTPLTQDDINNCGSHGTWHRESASCKCFKDYYGVYCTQYCNKDTTCNGNGMCTLYGTCYCDDTWSGDRCENGCDCNGRGKCYNETCGCFWAYSGEKCENIRCEQIGEDVTCNTLSGCGWDKQTKICMTVNGTSTISLAIARAEKEEEAGRQWKNVIISGSLLGALVVFALAAALVNSIMEKRSSRGEYEGVPMQELKIVIDDRDDYDVGSRREQ